jgi:MYXO-CTERM domain-containing protein
VDIELFGWPPRTERFPGGTSRRRPARRSLAWLLAGAALVLAAALWNPAAAQAACKGPGGTCGLLGGSCCSGSSCVALICVANCQNDGGLCISNSGCCGSRVCSFGFCRTPVGLGSACGPAAPCQSGLVCDPLSGFKCISNTAGLGQSCGPLVQCTSGLACDPLSGFKCISNTAGLGQSCGPLVQCTSGLACDPFSGFKCISNSAGIGQACGLLVHCTSGLACDPLSGFRCISNSAGAGQACGPLVQCTSGLTCDPLAGFKCVPETVGLGKACGPLVKCASGLVCDPLHGFRCVDNQVAQGQACGPLVQCGSGLFCDPLSGFRCVPAAGVDQACGPGVPCQSGLKCTLALRCSHGPAQIGETCDVTDHCGDGLFCQPGFPQRCHERKKVGEGCSIVNPCVDGASCELCLSGSCNAPFQCFYNSNQGAITENECKKLYSPNIHRAAQNADLTMTIATGDGAAALVGESQAFGVAYGQDGSYGCYTTLCGGINADVSIEVFASLGFYTDFEAVGMPELVNFQQVQLPGDLVNFETAQIFDRDGLVPTTLAGTEDAFSVGVGADILPFAAGSFLCATVLDTVITPDMPDAPMPLAVPPTQAVNSSFTFDLTGWLCADDGVCSWSPDDAAGSPGSGSGQVESPPSGSSSAVGRLESSCVRVTPGDDYDLSAWLKTSGAQDGVFFADWRPGLDCDGDSLATDVLGMSPPDDTWRELFAMRQAPMGAQSVRLGVTAGRDASTDAATVSKIDTAMVPEPGATPAAAAALLALGSLLARRRRR